MARHSFAVMALNMGVSIENLAKMMGHTDIKTTQIYAKVLNKSVQEDLKRWTVNCNSIARRKRSYKDAKSFAGLCVYVRFRIASYP